MRLAYRLCVAATLLLVLCMAGFIGDLVLNKRRVFYALLGRDAMVAACTPVLRQRLQALGFEPTDIAWGGEPDITISTARGKTLADTLTFADGPAETRVAGRLTCAVKDGVATVDVQTATTPTRAG